MISAVEESIENSEIELRRAFAEQRFEDASPLAEEFLKGHPNNPKARVYVANLAHTAGRTDLAEHFLRGALELDSNSLEAILGLAALLSTSERFQEAKELCQQAMRLGPNLGAPHFHYGRCLLTEGSYTEAVESLSRALTFTPKLAAGHHHLGLALAQLGQSKRAAECLQTAISLDPNSASSHAELANLLLEAGDTKGAILNLRKASECAPSPQLRALLQGRALIEEERFAEAEEALTKAIDTDPRCTEAHVILGRMLFQGGRFEEAKGHLLTALEIDPHLPDAFCLLATGKRITAEDRPLVGKMLALTHSGKLSAPERKPILYMLGKALEDLGEYEQAMQQYEAANRIAAMQMARSGRKFDRVKRRQLVDSTIEVFTSAYLEQCKSLGVTSEKPIFIVGMPRSGTTLLEQIISSHPRVGAVGELGNWGELSEAFQGMQIPSGNALEGVASSFLTKLEQASPGKEKVTEKTPQNYLILGQIHAAFPNARILHIRRNPVDTCLSIYFTAFMYGPEYAHDCSDLVFVYRQYERLMHHWRMLLPDNRFMEVRYEDLVADPEPFVRETVKFLGLEWDDACLHHERNAHAISTPSVWQARQPVFNTSVERWRRFEPWLGPLNELRDSAP